MLKSQPKENHHFYSIMSVVILLIISTGFANFYGPRVLGKAEPAPTFIHVHAAIFGAWLLAFVAQCLFVLKRKMLWHQRFGTVGFLLALVMMVSGVLTAVEAVRMGHRGIPGLMFPDGEGFLLLNVASLFVFGVLVGLGWFFRKQPAMHKRFMLMATVAGLAPPGIARLPLISGHTEAMAVVTILVVLVGLIYDYFTRGKPHKAYLFSLPLVTAILPPVVTTLSQTKGWRTIALLLLR